MLLNNPIDFYKKCMDIVMITSLNSIYLTYIFCNIRKKPLITIFNDKYFITFCSILTFTNYRLSRIYLKIKEKN